MQSTGTYWRCQRPRNYRLFEHIYLTIKSIYNALYVIRKRLLLIITRYAMRRLSYFFFFRIVPESVMRLILDFLADIDQKQKERDAMNLKLDLIKA